MPHDSQKNLPISVDATLIYTHLYSAPCELDINLKGSTAITAYSLLTADNHWTSY